MSERDTLRERAVWGFLILVMAIVIGAAIFAWLQKDYEASLPLPLYGTAEDFMFTERSGQPVRLADLRGKVWVADFVFTHCAGPCPFMTEQMAKLQSLLARYPNLRFVTVTVDPVRDTSEVLARYAESYGADPKRWLFLTGKKEDIVRFVTKNLQLALQDIPPEQSQPGFEVLHSTRFVLFDRKGRIRGSYPIISGVLPFQANEDELRKLRADIETLAVLPAFLIPVASLPTVNAVLNGTTALLLIIGFLFIHKKKVLPHKVCMGSALGGSILFLVSYLTYHYYVGSMPFSGQGSIRYIYFALLGSHTILAAFIVPLAVITLGRALKGNFEQHKKIAHWVLPIWLYVSVSGVGVYVMLYHLYPPV